MSISRQVSIALFAFAFFLLEYDGNFVYSTQDQLAVKISCQKDEIREYQYNSETSLWGEVDGKIFIATDVKVHCLGDDAGGKYGTEGLKYMVQLENLRISDKNLSGNLKSLRRRKRGFMDSVSNAWGKVKNFFKRLFGMGETEPASSRPEPPFIETEERLHPGIPDSPLLKPEYEEGPNDFKYDALYTSPFEFIQLPNGNVPEVLFSDEEKDPKVRNFKRHVVDAFTTQLSMHPRHEIVVETTVLGDHLSNYNITVNGEKAAFASSALLLEGDDPIDPFNDGKTVVVKKVVTEEDIIKIAPNSEETAINDRDKMGLKTQQTQIFKNGHLVSTSGISVVAIYDTKKKKRQQRDVNENKVMAFFKVRSSYEIQLHKRRRRRSTDYVDFKEQTHHFSTAARSAELEESSSRQKFRDLQMSIGNTTLFIQSLLGDKSADFDEKMQIIFEMVVQEVRFGLDHETQSVSEAIRKTITEQIIDQKCPTSLKECKEFLQLLARAGGVDAEQVLLSYVTSSSFDIIDRQEVADLLSDLSNPSPKVIDHLIAMLQASFLDPELIGPLSLSASNMLSSVKTTAASEKERQELAEVLDNILRESWSGSEENPLTIDALEAIGNLGHENSVDGVLEISAQAKERHDIQIACAHALRHMSALLKVQVWMRNVIINSPCDVKHAIVGSLLDQIYVQELAGTTEGWPRFGVKPVDIELKKYLESSSPEFACAVEDTARYFQRKSGPEAESLAVDTYFGSDSEPWEPDYSKGAKRRKRALSLNDLNCREWTEDNKYRPIQNKDEFAADRKMYNRSKSCLASRRLGLDNANSEIYAGMFAGVQDPSSEEESKRPNYKLLTKFVSGMNFMGHEMEIGSFHFYHHSGYTKAYIRILGRTRQEFRHDGCTPSDLKYRPITHIPLYRMSISVIQLSLGIHLSSQLALNTQCPAYDVYDLQPMSDVRIGGEARGSVLFARAALNLGGNFNYHLLFSFSPSPKMCLKGHHGYGPMSVSMEAYFRLWNVRKLRWGNPLVWRPSSLIWELNSGDQQPWFNDTCILSDSPIEGPPLTVAQPTKETVTSSTRPPPPPPPPEDDGNVVMVRAG